MSTRARSLRIVCLCLLGAVLSGCSFLRNEFFVFDRAAPAAEEPSGVDARS